MRLVLQGCFHTRKNSKNGWSKAGSPLMLKAPSFKLPLSQVWAPSERNGGSGSWSVLANSNTLRKFLGGTDCFGACSPALPGTLLLSLMSVKGALGAPRLAHLRCLLRPELWHRPKPVCRTIGGHRPLPQLWLGSKLPHPQFTPCVLRVRRLGKNL